MKQALLNFADALLSKEQMKGIKGGVKYCQCANGPLTPVSDSTDCSSYCGGSNPTTSPGFEPDNGEYGDSPSGPGNIYH